MRAAPQSAGTTPLQVIVTRRVEWVMHLVFFLRPAQEVPYFMNETRRVAHFEWCHIVSVAHVGGKVVFATSVLVEAESKRFWLLELARREFSWFMCWIERNASALIGRLRKNAVFRDRVLVGAYSKIFWRLALAKGLLLRVVVPSDLKSQRVGTSPWQLVTTKLVIVLLEHTCPLPKASHHTSYSSIITIIILATWQCAAHVSIIPFTYIIYLSIIPEDFTNIHQ